jgi:hypothetical protein
MVNKKTTQSLQLTRDSEEARKIAMWAIGHHGLTRAGATLTVVAAIACGIQLKKAKELLPHGEYEKWWKKYMQCISRRTVHRYLSLVIFLEHVAGGKCATVAHLLDVPPEKMTTEYAKQVAPHVAKVVEGKSLTQLYQDFGIIKARASKFDEARERDRRVAEASFGAPEDRQMYLALELFGEVREKLTMWETVIDAMPDAKRDEAVRALSLVIERLSGKKVRLA